MSYDTVLIANRGAIATRIIRTLRRMGLRSVAVYSETDEASLHVAMADEAVCIGGARATESYLNIPAILEAAPADVVLCDLAPNLSGIASADQARAAALVERFDQIHQQLSRNASERAAAAVSALMERQ